MKTAPLHNVGAIQNKSLILPLKSSKKRNAPPPPNSTHKGTQKVLKDALWIKVRKKNRYCTKYLRYKITSKKIWNQWCVLNKVSAVRSALCWPKAGKYNGALFSTFKGQVQSNYMRKIGTLSLLHTMYLFKAALLEVKNTFDTRGIFFN